MGGCVCVCVCVCSVSSHMVDGYVCIGKSKWRTSVYWRIGSKYIYVGGIGIRKRKTLLIGKGEERCCYGRAVCVCWGWVLLKVQLPPNSTKLKWLPFMKATLYWGEEAKV